MQYSQSICLKVAPILLCHYMELRDSVHTSALFTRDLVLFSKCRIVASSCPPQKTAVAQFHPSPSKPLYLLMHHTLAFSAHFLCTETYTLESLESGCFH